MSDILQITGSGDAPGVPRVYCDCDVCKSARLLPSHVTLAQDGLTIRLE